MAHQKQLDRLRASIDEENGCAAWNYWRENPHGKIFEMINLNGADLSGVNLSGVNLSNANLSGADLSEALLDRADLSGAFLDRADLSGADLSDAVLVTTDLSNADLRNADLSRVDLHLAYLSEANLCGAILCTANLNCTNLSRAQLKNADLSQCILIKTILKGADMSGSTIYGVSVWDVKVAGAIQNNLIISENNEPIITVDDLEVAQFIYLLLNNQKLRKVISTLAHKAVLILGRFTEKHLVVLNTIRDTLRAHDYLPILFDFEKAPERDYTETVVALAHLCRFVIADLSDPRSIQQELTAFVPTLEIPVQPIIEQPQKPWSMFNDFRRKYHWVLAPYEYVDIASLVAALPEKVLSPAEAKAKEIQRQPW